MLLLHTQAYETHGGMQAYMRRLAEIMSSLCLERNEPFCAVSVTDTAVKPELHPNPCHYDEFVPAGGSKVRFMKAAIAESRNRTHRLAVLGHLSLAPAGELLKRMGLIDDYIVVLHGIEAWMPKSRLIRSGCRSASAIVATTRYTAIEFQIQNIFAHPYMRVVPLALPESILPPPPAYRSEGKLTVLTVGRLDATERYKGVETLLRVVAHLASSGVPVELNVIGTGDDLLRMQSVAAMSAAPDAIQFRGGVSETEIVDAYRDCDVFAMPSQKEGFGIVFLEAMRYGKPCIGGNHGGTPEVFRHGQHGYLVQYGDENALYRYLLDLAGDRSLGRQLGLNAYAHTACEFAFPVMAQRWRNLLIEFAKPAGSRPCVA